MVKTAQKSKKRPVCLSVCLSVTALLTACQSPNLNSNAASQVKDALASAAPNLTPSAPASNTVPVNSASTQPSSSLVITPEKLELKVGRKFTYVITATDSTGKEYKRTQEAEIISISDEYAPGKKFAEDGKLITLKRTLTRDNQPPTTSPKIEWNIAGNLPMQIGDEDGLWSLYPSTIAGVNIVEETVTVGAGTAKAKKYHMENSSQIKNIWWVYPFLLKGESEYKVGGKAKTKIELTKLE